MSETTSVEPLARVRHKSPSELGLQPQVICPHCWHIVPPQDLLWVSEHHELLGDPILGPEVQARFKPSRFTLDCKARDARGMPCARLACPRCHLSIPRQLVDCSPLFISIIGVPASGKSYFLTSLTWQLRQQLPARFATSFLDADPEGNRSLIDYERTLFMQADASQIVALRKTELQGELYERVRLGDHLMTLPKPFCFFVKPAQAHPNASVPNVDRLLHRVLCLYDNAGEHFQPGMETSGSPVTRHLAKARLLMFLFDPTQDPRLRARLARDNKLGDTPPRVERQETVLTEAAARVRREVGLADGARHDRPLIVVVPKLDVWESLLDEPVGAEPFVRDAVAPHIDAVDLDRVEHVSSIVRRLLAEVCPEVVDAAEQFCEHVTYVPLSASGVAPLRDPQTGLLGFRPAELRPRWVTVPLLYAIARHSKGLIGGFRSADATSGAPATTVPLGDGFGRDGLGDEVGGEVNGAEAVA